MSENFEQRYKEKADITKAYIIDKIEEEMLSKTEDTIPLIIKDLDKIRRLEGVTGLRIFNSDGEEIFTEIKGPPEPGVKEVVKSGVPVNFHKKSDGSILFSSITPISNKPECLECHSKDEKLGAIMLSMSTKGMEGDIKRQKERYFLIFWIMCLTLGSITLFTVKKLFLEPLFLIYKGTEEIKKGNLDSKVPVKSRDEIGSLADSFNTMASSLKTSVDRLEAHAKELEVLNSISSAVTQSIDLEKVLKDVLAYLSKLELISTDGRALIFLADESKKQLRLAAYQEVSEDFIRSEEVVNYGNGLCGISAETGEIIISPDCLSDKRQSRGCESFVKHGHIILPLKVRGKLVGVLCLFTTPLQEVSDRVIHLYKTIADIISVAIENAKIHKTTLEIARTDGLTGLYNHTEFQHMLELEVQRAKRYGREFSLLMLDIDFFKNFNDTYGHQTGDDILKAISQNIKKEVRVMDVSARYGGEEFAVILPETPLQFGVQVAERLCKTVSCRMFHIQGSNVQVTLSIGVASFPADAKTSDDLIKKADQALYLAKNSGRNKVCKFSANI